MKLVWYLYRAVFFLIALAAWVSPLIIWAWIGVRVLPGMEGVYIGALLIVPILLTYWLLVRRGAPLVEKIDGRMARLLKPAR